MLPSSLNSPGAILHQTLGFLPPSVHFDPPSAMLKTSGNVLTLLLTSPPSSLSSTSTCLPKRVGYYSSLVSSAPDNPKRLWQTVNKLLHRKSSSPLPTTSPGTSPTDSFASFFHRQNIQTPSLSLASNPTTSSPHSPSPPATPPDFSAFTPASKSEVRSPQDPFQLPKQAI